MHPRPSGGEGAPIGAGEGPACWLTGVSGRSSGPFGFGIALPRPVGLG